MSDEHLPVRPKQPKVVDPHHVETAFVDWLVTAGAYDGVVNLTLGALDHAFAIPPDGLADAVITSRLRMSMVTAERLYNVLGGLLGKEPQAAGPITVPPANTPLH